jgi:DNA-binding MarR family transcriptional regulator
VARRDPDAFFESFSTLLRGVRAVTDRAYASLEVGRTQAKALRFIGKHGRLSQADLARATETDPTLTGRVLEPLIERGWVRRKRNEQDRRQYLLELTASGQRARVRVEEARTRVAQHMLAALDDRDLADFARIAEKLQVAFESYVDDE